MSELRKKTLSPARQVLVDLLSEIQFGRIEGLQLLDGEPHLGPGTRVVRTITFGGDSPARRAPASADFLLKRPLIDLFTHFDRIGNGRITYIDLKAGLPCFMAVEEPVGPANHVGGASSGERGEGR